MTEADQMHPGIDHIPRPFYQTLNGFWLYFGRDLPHWFKISQPLKSGVSVIICCYNSESTIDLVLEHLSGQKNTESIEWEVIVVDNASTDRTAEVARDSWTRQDVELRVVHEGNPGLQNARIKGLSSAQYSVAVFVDDDNLMSDHYIALAHEIMTSHSGVGQAGGLGVARTSGELPGWFRANEAAYAVGPQAEQKGYLPASRSYIHGAGSVLRKEVWDKLIDCGFEFLLAGRTGKSLASGEDSEITHALRLAGYSLWYEPEMRFEHIIPDQRLKWSYLKKLAREFGKSAVVLNLYDVRIQNKRGWDRIKVQSWLIAFGISIYNLFKCIPPYLVLRSRYREGNRAEYNLRYRAGYSQHMLKLAARYPGFRKKIAALHKKLIL